MNGEISFPNIGITLHHVGKMISIGGFEVAYYGIIIAFGMLAGYFIAYRQAKRLNVNEEVILDLAMWDIVFAIIGARLYYVIFDLDYYLENPAEIINTRGGGMAIYGGIIAGAITTFVFSKVKKLSFFDLADVACGGLLIGQIFGRWGNFFNREAFGGYTNNLLAMRLPRDDVRIGDLNRDILKNQIVVDGIKYVQVHPTFLYESLWNIGVLVVVLLYTKHRKYKGQLFFIYLFGYGLGRLWIEGLRTDQLKWFGTNIAVSQVLSGILVVVSGSLLLYHWIKRKRGQSLKMNS